MSQFRIRSEVAGGGLVAIVLLAMLASYTLDLASRSSTREATSSRMVEHPPHGSKDSALRALALALIDAEPAIRALWPGGWSFAPCLIFSDEPSTSAAVLITDRPPPP